MSAKNFIVSDYRELWDKNAKDLYILEPYVFHLLEKGNQVQQFNEIEVAPYRRTSREDIDNDARYVDTKYKKYVTILSKRLNEIHGTSHEEAFWKKALSMAFIRYITLFHDVFKNCELHLDVKNHVANILSADSYYVPLDFEDHRYLFQHNDYGQEQIFSLYARCFYPGLFTEIHLQPACFYKDINRCGLKNHGLIKKGMRKILSLIKMVPEKDIQVGVIGSFFSADNFSRLIKESEAKIHPVDWAIQLATIDKDISWDKRSCLSGFDDDFDRFDKFFFSTIPCCLPMVFVEHFKEIENLHSLCLSKYLSLRYILSEGWINDTFMSMLLALAQERGIKHINNEHNCFFHPYTGSFISHVIDMADIFLTLGWFDPKFKGLVKGASLFEFALNMKPEKKYEILYISGPSAAKVPHYSAAWGLDCENAPKQFEFVSKFFNNLSIATKKMIMYRGYPKSFLTNPMNYDFEYILREQIANIKGLANTQETSKLQMCQSQLLVIDYVSTSYIEALVMNIPTVVFWNTEAHYLNDEYSDFFKPLVDAKICQTDPVEAARFVESIADEPEKWWFSEEVQRGRDEFLNCNLGDPQVMINYLLSLTETI